MVIGLFISSVQGLGGLATGPPAAVDQAQAAADQTQADQAQKVVKSPAAGEEDDRPPRLSRESAAGVLAAAPPGPSHVAAGMLGFVGGGGRGAWEEDIPRSLEPEFAWLASCQLPSGAITLAPGDNSIVPYFANYAAMALLRWDVDAARRHMDWYLSRLNTEDRWGLDGTVYDYQLVDGQEVSQGDYDSADSYAATFLALVGQYLFATGDGQYLMDNLPALRRVAGVPLALQDPVDGLVWAKADHRYKFLMDNCEVQAGLTVWAQALRTLGLWEEAEGYAAAVDRIRGALASDLWQENDGSYAWAMTARGPRRHRRRWYPDTVGQLYPVLFGVVDPASDDAGRLLQGVNSAFPGWPELRTPDRFPWAMVAYAAALVGDEASAHRFVESASGAYQREGRPWPWYTLESVFYILTVMELANQGASAAR